MKEDFYYSVLKFRYNQLIGESLNVGVIFYFPGSSEVFFRGTNDLQRIKKAYSDVDLPNIKMFIGSFYSKAKAITKKVYSYSREPELLINEHFLVHNGSSLAFDKVKKAPVWQSYEKTVNHFAGIYLLDKDQKNKHSKRHDENHLRTSFHGLMTATAGERDWTRLIKSDERQLKGSKVEIQVKEFWQNGTTNLIKPFALDLDTSEGIEQKSFAFAKKVDLIGSTLAEDRSRLDLLVSKPSKSKLIETYNIAIDVLNEAKGPIRLVPEEQFSDYISEIWASAKELD